MSTSRIAAIGAVAVIALANSAQARITLEFDYTYDTNGFFSGPTGDVRRATLEEVGRLFSDRILDNLTAIDPNVGPFPGFNSWTAVIDDPADLFNQIQIDNMVIPANVVKIYAGGQAIPGPTLGIGGPAGFGASGTQEFLDNLATRGQPGVDSNTDFALWGGTITFDSDANWNFNLRTGPSAGQNDFYSVAAHELGHLLGFGTADSWEALLDGNNGYTGEKSMALKNGQAVPTTGADPSLPNSGHWVIGTTSPITQGTPRETVMSPSLTTGTRRYFTPLDFAGMDDLGWDLAIPGDANADGVINIADFLIIDRGDARDAWGFRNGDFDNDGDIDNTDFFIIDSNFLGGSVASPSITPTPVPEPGLLALILPAGLLALRRRR